MEFVDILRNQRAKLESASYVNVLWKEMTEGVQEDVDTDLLYQYRFHYPIDTENYFQSLLKKVQTYTSGDFDELDGSLKAYLLTSLYFCTLEQDPHVTVKESLLAAQLYIELIKLPLRHVFYVEELFKNSVKVMLLGAKEPGIVQVTQLLAEYATTPNLNLDSNLMSGIINCLNMIIGVTTVAPIGNFLTDTSVPAEIFKHIKRIFEHEQNDVRFSIILDPMFNCFRPKCCIDIAAEKLPVVKDNLRKFIKQVLFPMLDGNRLAVFRDVFMKLLCDTDFNCYDDAALMANEMELNNYKEIVRLLGLLLISKNHRSCMVNLMNMLYSLFKNRSSYHDLDKIEVLYDHAFNNCILQCRSPIAATSEKAVEVFAKICSLKNNEIVTAVITRLTNRGNNETLNLSSIMKAFRAMVDSKWTNNNKNKNVLIIVCVLLPSSNNHTNPEMCYGLLYDLCWDATPFFLKLYLTPLHELYLQMIMKGQMTIALAVLRIMFKMALHPSATSSIFVRHLYNSIRKPSQVNGVEYHSKYYSDHLLSGQFEYEVFFNKCRAEGLISYEHLDYLLSNINCDNTGTLKFMCIILRHLPCTDLKKILDYVSQKLSDVLILKENSKYIFEILSCILTWKPFETFEQENFPVLDCVYSTITDNLLNQTFPVAVFQKAFKLFSTLRRILQINSDTQILDVMRVKYNLRVLTTLGSFDNINTILYATELMLVTKTAPSGEVMRKLESMMLVADERRDILLRYPHFWTPLMIYFANITFIRKAHVDLATDCLVQSLNCENLVLKIAAIKLLYTISNEITHDFEPLTDFAFKEIVGTEVSLAKLCASLIENLVHDDYLKLSAEQYMLLVYLLGYPDVNVFMRELLGKRFVSSNQNVISRYFVQIMIYVNQYLKHPNYIIMDSFLPTLRRIRINLTRPKDIYSFLFNSLCMKSKLNVLQEIVSTFDELMKGTCKVEEGFYDFILHCVYICRIATPGHKVNQRQFYAKTIKFIEKRILQKDCLFLEKEKPSYPEHDRQIKLITRSMIKFLVYNEANSSLKEIRFPLFEAIMYWTDFFTRDIANYVHVERVQDFQIDYNRLVQFYQKNKQNLFIL